MAAVDPAFKSIPKGSSAFLIWRIENLQLVPYPKSQYGTFYNGDSYIVYAASEYNKPCGTDVRVAEVRGPLEVHIHFWLGEETSVDEAATAAIKTVELDDFLSGHPVQHREAQGNESARFKSYFKSGFTILKGGVATGLHHVTDNFVARLFHIKGRRLPTVTQLPTIKWDYFNSGDVFILDTKDVVFVWTGKTANNMEKIQAAKVASKLKTEHNASSIVFVDDGKEGGLPQTEKQLFTSLLNLKDRKVKTAEEAGKDEELEENLRNSITLYRCTDEEGTYKVIEVKTGPLHQTDLTSDDSFIVDNGPRGSWVWIGRRASPKERVEAVRNAHGFITKKGYPSNTPVTRVIDGGEPTEFKMLFSTWKDKNQSVGLGKQNSTSNIAVTVHTKLDASTLHEKPQLAAKSQLVDDGTGKKTVWRVKSFDLEAVPEDDHGIFFSGDSYVVKYTYGSGGSERCLIYYWLGLHSPADEQGTAALKTIELDDALGGAAVQVRVVQGKEPPHFLKIFKGSLMIYRGGYQSSFDRSGQPGVVPSEFLLHVRGNQEQSTKAIEVELRAASLNSNDVFVLKAKANCFVWFGKGSTGDEREMAKRIANSAARGDYAVVYEGQEKQDFWDAIGGKEDYASDKRLTESNDSYPPRLFQLSNAAGFFKAEEIINFDQTDLISEDVMMLDAYDAIYLWIGKNSNTEERKLAIQTAMDYLDSDPTNRNKDTPILQVKQGYEPPTFTGFFGVWDPSLWKNNKTFQELKRELEGGNAVIQVRLEETNGDLDFHDHPKYPLEFLQTTAADDLPEDVDRLRREVHLSIEEFTRAFNMTYTEFAALPAWKQSNLKKAAKLF